MDVHVRRYRLARGLKIVELSRLIPCNPATLSLIERGKQTMTLDRLVRLAHLLQVHPYELVTYPEFEREEEL